MVDEKVNDGLNPDEEVAEEAKPKRINKAKPKTADGLAPEPETKKYDENELIEVFVKDAWGAKKLKYKDRKSGRRVWFNTNEWVWIPRFKAKALMRQVFVEKGMETGGFQEFFAQNDNSKVPFRRFTVETRIS